MNYNKIKGSILGSALGDALGAAPEMRDRQQIVKQFNGYITGFVPIPSDTFARDYPEGTVTDDFSAIYYVLETLINNDLEFNKNIAEKCVMTWGDDDYYCAKFAGPTTRSVLENIRKGRSIHYDPRGIINHNEQATNGGAMKAASVGLLARGDIEKAVEYAIELTKVTHNNTTAISGACAIAAAVAQAQNEDADLEKICQAAMWGADEGLKRTYSVDGENISVAPKVSYKISEAIKVAQETETLEELMITVDEKIGTNITVTESVPAVFAIIVGTKGSLSDSLYVAINAGGDTDSVASMIGGILGGFEGSEVLDEGLLKQMYQANPRLEIENITDRFAQLLLQ